ncbi:hypothetical protein JXA47_02580 [Candidatus Sumerlaeota bacterium]|nr:hypothetical protein [Candidatus Sumerlaeota bacterium]
MSEHRTDAEGYPTDPTARAQEKRLEQMLGELPRATAPEALRAEVMAELRATPPGLMTRLRRFWGRLGGWRVPIQLAPIATLVVAVVIGRHFLTPDHEAPPSTATLQSTSLDGQEIATAVEPDNNAITRLGAHDAGEDALERQTDTTIKDPELEAPREITALRGGVEEPVEPEPSEAMEPTEVALAEPAVDPEELEAPMEVTEAAPQEPPVEEEPSIEVAEAPEPQPVEQAPEMPPLQPTESPRVVAMPVGPGPREEVERLGNRLFTPEEIGRLRSQSVAEQAVPAPPEPSFTSEDEPTAGMTIASTRIDEQMARPIGLGTPPPTGSTFSDTFDGGPATPPAMAFHPGLTVTSEQLQAARQRSTPVPTVITPSDPGPVERLSFNAVDPQAVVGSIRPLVESYNGWVNSQTAVTSDHHVWRVIVEVPRWRIDSLREEIARLCQPALALTETSPPSAPGQIPPAMREVVEVEIMLQRSAVD